MTTLVLSILTLSFHLIQYDLSKFNECCRPDAVWLNKIMSSTYISIFISIPFKQTGLRFGSDCSILGMSLRNRLKSCRPKAAQLER